MPPGARHHPDGSITFPMKGKPPRCDVPGYMEDPEDPYRWIMIYCPCKWRVVGQEYICPSGKVRRRDYCNLINLSVNPRYCNVDCKEIKV